jgi:hypothetical protein
MQAAYLKLFGLGFCAVAATAGRPAAAGHFVYTSIDVPGAYATYPVSISDQGAVAGVYTTSSTSPQYGFVWANGTMTTFAPPGGRKTIGVAGISNHGTVAFSAGDNRSGVSQAKLRHPGGIDFRLPTPAGNLSWTEGINGAGQIVGSYEASIGSENRTGFLYQKGQIQDLVFPGAALTTPSGIGDNGTVIGTYNIAGDDTAHGFTYSNGSYQSFDPPGSTETIVSSINPHGDIAGTFYTAELGTGTLGYVFSGGKFHIHALKRGREYVNEVKWAGSPTHVAGNFYNLFNQIGFMHVDGQYYQVLPFASLNSYIYGGNRHGTLTGLYWGADNVLHGFVAVCPDGQAPCTN